MRLSKIMEKTTYHKCKDLREADILNVSRLISPAGKYSLLIFNQSFFPKSIALFLVPVNSPTTAYENQKENDPFRRSL